MTLNASFKPHVPWGTPAALLVGVTSAALGILFASILIYGLEGLVDDTVFKNTQFTLVYYLIALALIWAFVLYRKGNLQTLGFHKFRVGRALKYILIGISLTFLVTIVAFAIIEIFAPQINLDAPQETGFENAVGGMELVLTFIVLVILTPLYEEILFRGFLMQGMVKRFGAWGAIILSSLIFALLHAPLAAAVAAFAVGVMIGWVFAKTNSIIPAILLHSLKNLIAFFSIYQVF